MSSDKKPQTTVKLTGYKTRNAKARIGAEVSGFMDDGKQFAVIVQGSTALLKTAKGGYELIKHKTANRFQGICNGIKVHFCPQKITAKLIYWS